MHPYKSAPAISFWNRSVSSDFFAASLLTTRKPLIRWGDRIATAGSCFASHLVPYLEKSGYSYVRTERQHPAVGFIAGENLAYDAFSAAYGNVYTARQLLQLLQRSTGAFTPVEDRWRTEAGVLDPFRPGLRYHALTDREFDLLTTQHLRAVRQVFEQADVFVFTLGLTEAWVSSIDGAVFPACPGTITGSFDPARHAFVNFSPAEVTADLGAFVDAVRAINPRLRLVLTVSPVPLFATATGQHVLCASTYSKAVLRVAAEQACRQHPDVTYFPAYEIVTGAQAPRTFFRDDHRSVTTEAIETVMEAFLCHCEPQSDVDVRSVDTPASGSHAAVRHTIGQVQVNAPALSQAIVDAECEEAMAERSSAAEYQPAAAPSAPWDAQQ